MHHPKVDVDSLMVPLLYSVCDNYDVQRDVLTVCQNSYENMHKLDNHLGPQVSSHLEISCRTSKKINTGDWLNS